MKKVQIVIANLIWVICCAKSWFLFKIACHYPEAVQKKLLLRIIQKNKNTDFGKKQRLSEIRTVEDFRKQIPIANYESYVVWIDRIGQGIKNVLTADEVTILEPTSGSTSGRKLIPFTESLKEEFLAGISPWIFDLFTSWKCMLSGTSYWSITPITVQHVKSSGGLPIGFKDDSEYFGKLERFLIGSVMSVPKEVSELSNMRNFQYATLLFLLKDRALAFISVWNPTFLTIILSRVNEWKESLVKDIFAGTISFPEKINALVAKKLEKKFKRSKQRSLEIASIMGNPRWRGECGVFWPKLSVISCWADGSSQYYIGEIKRLFPNVHIQPKGLLATEGIVSFPLLKEQASVLSLRSHFYEFIEQGTSNMCNSCKLLHEIDIGKTYAVVITTGGGLYRYQLGDLVTVIGFWKKCPLIRFQGRGGNISDLFGEKLNENHVAHVLSNAFKMFNFLPNFFMVAPEKDWEERTFYTLFLEIDNDSTATKHVGVQELAKEIEKGLSRNVHYKYCRDLGQLSSLRTFLIKEKGAESYLRASCSLGQKLGDIKMMVLRKEFGWSTKFSGSFFQ